MRRKQRTVDWQTHDWRSDENQVLDIVLREANKRPSKMNMDLIVEGLDLFHPFDEIEDAKRTMLAWRDFLRRYDLAKLARQNRFRIRFARLVLVALILLALGTGIGFALGVNIWQVTIQWTRENLFMWLVPTSQEEPVSPGDVRSVDSAAEVWGDDLYEMMKEAAVQVTLPSWKPEEFEFVSSDMMHLEIGTIIISAEYQDASTNTLNLLMWALLDEGDLIERIHIFESDETLQSTYSSEERVYYIMSNLEQMSLAWIDGTCVIQITGSITEAQIYDIINSMQN